MSHHRQPDAIPYADADISEEYDGAKIIYIERPTKRNDSIGHILQGLTLAVVMALAGFVWRYTITNESRMTVLEVQSVYFKERLADLMKRTP